MTDIDSVLLSSVSGAQSMTCDVINNTGTDLQLGQVLDGTMKWRSIPQGGSAQFSDRALAWQPTDAKGRGAIVDMYCTTPGGVFDQRRGLGLESLG